MIDKIKEGEMKIGEQERQVLIVLSDYWHEEGNCIYFKTIEQETKLNTGQVRRACRSLARKDLAEFHRGLFTEDGEVAGSGYCASEKGAYLIDPELFKSFESGL